MLIGLCCGINIHRHLNLMLYKTEFVVFNVAGIRRQD